MLADADLVPPMPTPPERVAGLLPGLLRARGDLLPLFPARAYRGQVMSLRLLARRLVIVNDPAMVREVFVVRHETYARKSRLVEQALEPVVGDSFFVTHGALWQERRDIVAPPIHPAKVAGFHPCFVAAAEALAADLDAAGGAEIDMAAAFAGAIAHVLLLSVFGPDAPRAEARRIADAFTAYQLAVENLDILHMLGLPDVLSGLQGRRARRLARDIRVRVGALIDAAGGTGGTALLAALRDARRPDGTPAMDREALLNEVTMLLLAGSEGAANTLTWCSMLLAQHQATAERLRTELDMLPPGPPSAEAVAGLALTRAVVNETMRLYPPVPILARQALRPDRIRRWAVPAGSLVMAVPWLLHRHEAIWEKPHAFLPDRFLGEAAKRHPRFAFIPFGLGPRVCAGANFGMAEVMTFAAILFRRFRFALAPGFRPMPRLRLALRPRDGMRMVVARR